MSSTTFCRCLQVRRTDGLEIGVTTLDRKVAVAGFTYLPGLDVSDIVSTNDLAVDNLELTVLAGDDDLDVDLEHGRWDNATFRIFEVNWRSPADPIRPLKSGTTGIVQIGTGKFVLELRSLKQALQQEVGVTASVTCRAAFADWPRRAGSSRCGLSAADWTVTGALTDVVSAQVFSDADRSEADDWFGEGILTMTSGAAAGFAQKVKTYAGGTGTAGTFTLSLPLPYQPAAGDTYSVIAGCRKRHSRTLANPTGPSDCLDKFNNVPNFQGEPHLPGIDAITANPSTT